MHIVGLDFPLSCLFSFMLSSCGSLAGRCSDWGSQCVLSERAPDVLVQLTYLSPEYGRRCGGFHFRVTFTLLLLGVARLRLVLKLSLQVCKGKAVLGVVFRRHVTPDSSRCSAGCFSSALFCPVGPRRPASLFVPGFSFGDFRAVGRPRVFSMLSSSPLELYLSLGHSRCRCFGLLLHFFAISFRHSRSLRAHDIEL